MTNEDRQESEALGLLKTVNIISETLRIAGILNANGVDLSKILITKKSDGKQKHILLGEIEQDGVNIQEIIKKNRLDEKYKYGLGVTCLRNAYSGKRGKITEAEKEQAVYLGLISETLIEKEKKKQEAIRENKQAEEIYDAYIKLLGDKEKQNA